VDPGPRGERRPRDRTRARHRVRALLPAGPGLLVGQVPQRCRHGPDDTRRNHPRFQGDNFAKNLELVERITRSPRRSTVSPSQLALAWVLAQGDDVVPIPGTKHVSYLIENLGALDIQLTADDLARIDAAAPFGSTAGDRYPDMSTVNV
jgi:aryl-alcohol dehydrogenase-like predicted oxidoreductase